MTLKTSIPDSFVADAEAILGGTDPAPPADPPAADGAITAAAAPKLKRYVPVTVGEGETAQTYILPVFEGQTDEDVEAAKAAMIQSFSGETRKDITGTWAENLDEALDDALLSTIEKIHRAWVMTFCGTDYWWGSGDADMLSREDFTALNLLYMTALNEAYDKLADSDGGTDLMAAAAGIAELYRKGVMGRLEERIVGIDPTKTEKAAVGQHRAAHMEVIHAALKGLGYTGCTPDSGSSMPDDAEASKSVLTWLERVSAEGVEIEGASPETVAALKAYYIAEMEAASAASDPEGEQGKDGVSAEAFAEREAAARKTMVALWDAMSEEDRSTFFPEALQAEMKALAVTPSSETAPDATGDDISDPEARVKDLTTRLDAARAEAEPNADAITDLETQLAAAQKEIKTTPEPPQTPAGGEVDRVLRPDPLSRQPDTKVEKKTPVTGKPFEIKSVFAHVPTVIGSAEAEGV